MTTNSVTNPTPSFAAQTKSRNDGVDYLRGLLIALVIIGHVVVGSIHDNWVRYSIYAFHMPLFIGLTGYLLNPSTLKTAGWLDLGVNYWWRLIFPFAFAYVFFTGILTWHAFEEQRISAKLLLSYVHTPYYHLWFIPTLILWLIAFRLILKTKFPLVLALTVTALVSLYWASVPKDQQLALLALITSKKVCYFFSFFLFGAWLRSDGSQGFRHVVGAYQKTIFVLSLVLGAIYLTQIGQAANPLRGPTWWVMNVLLISLAIPWSQNLKLASPSANNAQKPINQALIGMGRQSLPIYLWHVVPLFILKGLDVHQNQLTLYYLISIFSSVLIVFLVLKFEGKSRWSNRVFYGG